MKENIIQQMCLVFAIKIVNAYQYLQIEKLEYVLSKQMLKSGMSVCVPLEKAIEGNSKINPNTIISTAYKEAYETMY